jgi:hypothetical protein
MCQAGEVSSLWKMLWKSEHLIDSAIQCVPDAGFNHEAIAFAQSYTHFFSRYKQKLHIQAFHAEMVL